MRLCPQGHEMTPENIRVRFIRTSLYEHRECRMCLRARRKSPSTEAERAAKRAYYRSKRDGTYVPKRQRLTVAEVAALDARHKQRLVDVGYDWARKRKSKAARLREARVERDRLTIVRIRAEEAERLTIASMNPELATLIEEQARDARTFNLARTARFVPQDWAERLFYGESNYQERAA